MLGNWAGSRPGPLGGHAQKRNRRFVIRRASESLATYPRRVTDEPATASRRPPDPDLLSRWIAIAHLVTGAEELQSRESGAWPSLSLISADTANEALLGLIAGAGKTPPGERDPFERLFELARDFLNEQGQAMPQSLVTRVMQVHRGRNLAVHTGVGPALQLVQSAVRTAHDLRALAVDGLQLLEAFRDSGPVRAVAEQVDLQPVSGPLREADRSLREAKFTEAADWGAVVLDAVLARVDPRLRDWGHHPPQFRGSFPGRGGFGSEFERAERALQDEFKAVHEREDRLEAWVLALGLGLRPVDLARLQHTLGRPWRRDAQSASVTRSADADLSPQRVEAAILLTTDLVYRLWQSGSLGTGNPWEQQPVTHLVPIEERPERVALPPATPPEPVSPPPTPDPFGDYVESVSTTAIGQVIRGSVSPPTGAVSLRLKHSPARGPLRIRIQLQTSGVRFGAMPTARLEDLTLPVRLDDDDSALVVDVDAEDGGTTLHISGLSVTVAEGAQLGSMQATLSVNDSHSHLIASLGSIKSAA